MYIKNTYYVGEDIEVEKVHSYRYGKRVPVHEKVNPTSETVKNINFRNKVKKLRRLIMNNFTSDDFHVVLTYRKESRPDMEEAKRLLHRFHEKMKRMYDKLQIPYKWICTTEYRTAAIHHHIILNHAPDIIRILGRCWKHGHINLSPLYQDMDVEGLAEYLLKETKDTAQKKQFGEIKKNVSSYTKSRNVVHPRKETEIVSAKEWRREPKAPKGYYIIKDLLKQGIGEFGYPYQYYRMRKIKKRE